MKIIWNKVTPVSKIIALALFVALPFIGFWLGMQYGAALQAMYQSPSGGNGSSAVGTDYYRNVAAWQKDSNNPGFSIAYPIDFDYQETISPAPTVGGWRVNAGPDEPGIVAFTLTIPRALEPQTNFADAKLTVGYSANDRAIANCMKPDQSEGPGAMATSSATLNGTPFTVFHSAGAGAGNLYETTSYRTLHAGKCWAVEYIIHSTQIANYPASYGLQPFDKAYVAGILDRIVGTFNLTK